MKKTRIYYENRSAEICAQYLDGATVKDVAITYGVTPRQIRYTLQSAGVRLRESRRKKKSPEEILRDLGLTRYDVRRLLIQRIGIAIVLSTSSQS